MFYTYVLQSDNDGQFYTGYTTDLKLRPALLNPAKLGCKEAFNRVKAAPKRPRRIYQKQVTPEPHILRSLFEAGRCAEKRTLFENVQW